MNVGTSDAAVGDVAHDQIFARLVTEVFGQREGVEQRLPVSLMPSPAFMTRNSDAQPGTRRRTPP